MKAKNSFKFRCNLSSKNSQKYCKKKKPQANRWSIQNIFCSDKEKVFVLKFIDYNYVAEELLHKNVFCFPFPVQPPPASHLIKIFLFVAASFIMADY